MPPTDRWPVPGRTPTEPRRRRRLRFPRPRKAAVLVLTAVVAVGAGVATDRAVASTITSRVADELRCELGSASRSTLVLSGPFVLPQLLSGDLRQVDVSVQNIPVSGSTADLDVSLHGVDLGGLFTSEDKRTIRVGSGTAHAEISNEALSSLASQQLGGTGVKITSHDDALSVSFRGDDLLKAWKDSTGSRREESSLVESIGQDLLGSVLSGKTITAGLKIGVDGGDITIVPRSFHLGDQEISLETLRNLLGAVPEAADLLDARRVSPSQLPDFIHLASLSPTATGLSLTAQIDHAELSPEALGSDTDSTCRP
jgi:hypothetical protein